MKILGVYKITYPEYNVIQYKNLILTEDYVNDIKPLQIEIAKMEAISPKSKFEKKISELKKYLKQKYGSEWFTDTCPLWDSQFTNNIMELGPNQGGSCIAILKKIQ